MALESTRWWGVMKHTIEKLSGIKRLSYGGGFNRFAIGESGGRGRKGVGREEDKTEKSGSPIPA